MGHGAWGLGLGAKDIVYEIWNFSYFFYSLPHAPSPMPKFSAL